MGSAIKAHLIYSALLNLYILGNVFNNHIFDTCLVIDVHSLLTKTFKKSIIKSKNTWWLPDRVSVWWFTAYAVFAGAVNVYIYRTPTAGVGVHRLKKKYEHNVIY